MHKADLLDPVDIPSRLDQLDLYLGQVCAVAGISKMQLDYWTTKAGSRPAAASSARMTCGQSSSSC